LSFAPGMTCACSHVQSYDQYSIPALHHSTCTYTQLDCSAVGAVCIRARPGIPYRRVQGTKYRIQGTGPEA
jgi:hypothetical protein